jgi:PAS domain S-box-containing protein
LKRPRLAGFEAPSDILTPSPCGPETGERYELLELHDVGGVGRVWHARDKTLERTVALKELKSELADDTVLRARFQREAKLTGRLEHPGIVPVYDLVSQSDSRRAFYTMRFVRGRTLAQAACEFRDARQRRQADMTTIVSLLNAFVAVCNTVAYSHSRGIIHRDLKGQNVVLGDFGETVVLDWGFAKQTAAGDSDDELLMQNGPIGEGDSELTLQGQTLGTPAYMAPEQAAGRLDLIDHRTDVYGLGATLYHLLTGNPPFIGSDVEEVLRKVRTEEPIPPRQLWPEVPQTLQAACLRALSKEPSARFTSARELACEVERWQEVQRQQAIDALRESEALYYSLVECISLNVWRKDLEGRFTFVSKGFLESTGLTREQMIGRTDHDLFPHDLADKYRRDDEQVHKTGQTLRILEPVSWAGEGRVFEVIKIPIHDAYGQIIGTQGVFWDPASWARPREVRAQTSQVQHKR